MDFTSVYDSFLSKITDDMFLELTEADTKNMLGLLLAAAIPHYEFPKVSLSYDSSGFSNSLTAECINIISHYMIVEWLGQQLASVEMTRQKYSGKDFSFTSQANHLQKLQYLKERYTTEGFHLQRLEGRRTEGPNGRYRTTMSQLVEEDDD